MQRDDVIDFTTTGAVVDDILVIDSDEEHNARLKALLEARGIAVATASTGGQAHSSYMMRKPDFVIMEFVLPGESGFEICEWIKSRSKATPVMAVTDIDLDESRALASRVGVDAYMVKPYDDDALFEMIGRSAEVVWQRMHEESTETEDEFGKMSFSCKCGKKFQVTVKNKGKTLFCNKCKERVRIPDVLEGGRMLTWRPDDDSTRTTNASDSLRFVTVKCQHCGVFYSLFLDTIGKTKPCPKCDKRQEGSLSIKGAPLSRAALANSMRTMIFLNGPARGKKLLLPEGKDVFVGREKECTIRAKSANVSARHAVIRADADGLRVRDLDSTHGTWVNESRISEETLLRPRDLLQIGPMKFLIAGDESEDQKKKKKVKDNDDDSLYTEGRPTNEEAAEIIEHHWAIVRHRAQAAAAQ